MNQRSGSIRKALTSSHSSCLFLAACQRSAETRQTAEAKSDKPSAPVAQAPDVEIFVDEAMLKKPHAVLGGTVKNVGTEKLEISRWRSR